MRKKYKKVFITWNIFFVFLSFLIVGARTYAVEDECKKFMLPKKLECYLRKADDGDSYAQSTLADMYFEGHVVQQDYVKAFNWFSRSAEAGRPYAQFKLGTMYFNGQGTLKKYDLAFYWYKKAASKDYAEAQYSLGKVYDQALEKFTRWYEEAESKNFNSTQDEMFISEDTGDALLEAVKDIEEREIDLLLHPVNDKEFLESLMGSSSVSYSDNDRLDAEKKQRIESFFRERAFSWYLLAAKGGNYDAKYEVGIKYFNTNIAESSKWLQEAAKAGHKGAMEFLKEHSDVFGKLYWK